MPRSILIADSGATKAEWCFLQGGKKKTYFTQGISPYFLSQQQIIDIINKELVDKLKKKCPDEIYYYGTGCANPANAKIVRKALSHIWNKASIEVNHDLLGIAKASCGNTKGIACIMGTGSNSCYYDGKKIQKISPGLGYILGDEGSGAYLGKKVIQYYLYETFDDDLRSRFEARYSITKDDILENVYKKPLANRYLASFTLFLAENRGHYMIENIIEDGLNDFFYNHLTRFRETSQVPVHFVGSVGHGFKDVLQDLCKSYDFELGKVLKNPMQGLVEYHRTEK